MKSVKTLLPRSGHIYVADLEPKRGAEPGKQRPVLVVQSDLLNPIHPTVIVCPLSSLVKLNVTLLRVHVAASKVSGLKVPSDILIDQLRAIDCQRLKKQLGQVSESIMRQVRDNIRVLMDLG